MRYFGKVAFGITEETAPDVYTLLITEREYMGDVLDTRRKMISSTNLNDDIVINNKISIVSDAFGLENFSTIQYIEFMGAKWKVTDVEVQPPRLILTMGGVYNAQQA